MSREPWDYDKALEEDLEFERRLPVKEGATVVLILIVLAIRILLG